MSETNPLVSVIIPSFNRASTIIRALKSVQSQTYPCIEIIVVDDGSTDETKDLIKNEADVKYIYQENQGVSSARNRGVKEASASLIAFLDSDDEWHPNKLSKQVFLLQENKEFKWVHCNEIWMRNGVEIKQQSKHQKGGGRQFSSSLELCVIAPSAVLLRKEIFSEVEGFREDFPVCEDYDLWLKLTSKFNIGFLEEALLTKHGGHADQLSTKFFAMDYYRVKAIDGILEKGELPLIEQEKAQRIIVKKSELLIKGYQKHNNLTNLGEVKSLLSKYV